MSDQFDSSNDKAWRRLYRQLPASPPSARLIEAVRAAARGKQEQSATPPDPDDVAELYRRLPTPPPSGNLIERLRRAARGESHAEHSRRRWLVPTAWAASVLLASTVALSIYFDRVSDRFPDELSAAAARAVKSQRAQRIVQKVEYFEERGRHEEARTQVFALEILYPEHPFIRQYAARKEFDQG